MLQYRKPKGTRDLDSKTTEIFEEIRSLFLAISKDLGYSHIEIPIFESTKLFERSTGETTEIITKQMYKFQDGKNREFSLRPEGTPGLIRAAVENNWLNEHNGNKFSYFGPFFRYERPQKGRYRQFFQLGAEFVGSNSLESDAECIYFLSTLLKELKVKNMIKINSLGTDKERLDYLKSLKEWLKENEKDLSEKDLPNIDKNPLRILDSKRESTIALVKNAPKIHNFWGLETSERFKKLTSTLDKININYEVDSCLVRGLDYYSSTVFEAIGHEGAQDAYGGGGRYDSLVSDIGGNESPAVGFAAGVDRIASAIEMNNLGPFCVFLPLGEECRELSFPTIAKLWDKGIPIKAHWNENNLKKALKRANSASAEYVLIFGEKEKEKNIIICKNMKDGDQKEIPMKVSEIASALGLSLK